MEIREKSTLASIENYIRNIDTQRKPNPSQRQSMPACEKEGDTVALSAEAKQLQALTQRIKSMPETREEKIATIRNQLISGSYQIDAAKIAAAMFKDALSDENT
jgi:negative regulator of flagellin synthesis FlgM